MLSHHLTISHHDQIGIFLKLVVGIMTGEKKRDEKRSNEMVDCETDYEMRDGRL